MKHLKTIVLLGVILLTLAACGSAADTIVAVGQTVTMYDVQATVTGIGGSYFNVSADGESAEINVHVKLTNTSSSEINYSPLAFHIKSGAGTITGPHLLAPLGYQADLLGAGHLLPGGTVEGDLIFPVTVRDHQATVTWQPTATDSDSGNGWILGL